MLLLPEDFVGNCVRRFEKSCEGDGAFVDRITLGKSPIHSFNDDYMLEDAKNIVETAMEARCLRPHDLVRRGMFAASAAYAHGDMKRARESLYDCIAVCMRFLCVCEGKSPAPKAGRGRA